MPELAEVEYYRKRWLPAMGQSVERIRLHPEKRIFRGVDSTALARDLTGSTFTAALRHGKQMCFRFGDRHWLGVHLGMTGKLRFASDAIQQAKHDHLVLDMQGGGSMVFSDPRLFGRILYANTAAVVPDWWRDLPPEVLSKEFTQEWMNGFLDRRAGAPIKAVLLMQERFPGIGNWMADEILWRARIHPATRAGRISRVKRRRLYACIREVSEDALAVIGTEWNRPPDDWLFNHRWKDGGQCPKTGGRLRRESIGGRTTCWSPKWQQLRV
ncbi:MAG: Fpg/Nei family DNA glycosylase [Verrucomicrobia bacterium]|jgi:formamidopyrimidine-DNA glycosylase|nr:Fpg/Nei family DNA glycosylase [Verrucomicrobiota bacterium]